MSNIPHGAELEPTLRELDKKLITLRIDPELFKIIHRPGWTTPAEFFLVKNTIEQIKDTHSLLEKQLHALIEGSRLIAK